MTEPQPSRLPLAWPRAPRRTDLARRRSKIVAATQIEDISFLFLHTGNNGEQQTRSPGVLAALETAKVVASPLPRRGLALAGRILSLPLRELPRP
jgi:hypothetical protein